MTKRTQNFLQTLLQFYDQNRRDMPWRQTTDPYKIMVSEIMLQQTQVARVIPKYQAFLNQFPDVRSLANSDLSDVLREWSGLGYNRRAKFLWQAAQKVMTDFDGKLPKTILELMTLPGIGKNTAGAIISYAYDQPVVFIETNIRTVLLHHFFKDQTDVTDKQLEAALQNIMQEVDDPRTFYWAMMDYGTFLKTTHNNIRRSKHYAKQSMFAGSKRQVRGQIIRTLVDAPRSLEDLQAKITDNRLITVLSDLCDEQLIVHKNGRYRLG